MNRITNSTGVEHMSKFEAFIEANPTDPRVVRILKLIDTSALNSRVGKLIGQLMREVEAA